jgi:hypothetical protein
MYSKTTPQGLLEEIFVRKHFRPDTEIQNVVTWPLSWLAGIVVMVVVVVDGVVLFFLDVDGGQLGSIL